MLKELFYRWMLFLDRKIVAAKIRENMKYVSLGENSQLYGECRIINMTGEQLKIVIGKNTHIRGELLTMNYGGSIEMGDNCFLGEYSRIWSGDRIKIGSNVLISHQVNISDTDTHELDANERREGFVNIIRKGQPKQKGSIKTKPIVIEDNVWISFNAVILKGVSIGTGAIVAAGAVVTKDVPAYCMVAGNPAVVVKKLNKSS